MSLTSGPINESEQAGEKLADHIAGRLPQDAAAVVGALLAILEAREMVIRISLERKP